MKRAVAGTMLIFAFASLAPVTHAASKPGGTFTRHTFDAPDPTFSRDYLLFAPRKRSRPTSLVVYLHGCSQTATDAALGTRWNDDGNTQAKWTDPLGPDVTTASYEFFKTHPMP